MKQVTNVAYSADGSYFVVVFGEDDKSEITVWDSSDYKRIATLQIADGEGLVDIDCSPDGKYIIAADASGIIYIWYMDGQRVLEDRQVMLEDVDEVTALGFSLDSKYLFVAMDSYITIWQLSNWAEITTLSGYYSSPSTAAFVSNNNDIIIGEYGALDYCDILKEEVVHRINVSAEPIVRICLPSSVNHQCYVWDTFDIFVWDLRNNEISLFNNQSDMDRPCIPGDVSYDGKLLVSIFGKKVFTLDTASKNILQRYIGHTKQVINVIFSPDAKHILTASWDGTARLWDTYSGVELQRFSL